MSLSKYSGRITPSPERKYELIRSPIITEKSTLITEFNQVSFRVPMNASKPEIKKAVEDLKIDLDRGIQTSSGQLILFN